MKTMRLPALLAGATFLAGVAVVPAVAQMTDDAQFRAQQELRRLDTARENSRIERERALSASPPGIGSARGDPTRNLDYLREQNRLRDDANRIERDTDRLRGEQQRYERDRLFSTPPGTSPPAWRP
jgi:hypothetical protein